MIVSLMCTTSHRRSVNVPSVTSRVSAVAGAKARTIVRSSVRSIVRPNVRRVAVLAHVHVSAAIFSVPAVVRDPHSVNVLLVRISTMMVFARKNVRLCKNTIQQIICGK